MGRKLLLKAVVFASLMGAVVGRPSAVAATPTLSGEPVVAVVTFAGVDALWQDVDLVQELGDFPALRPMVEGFVEMQTSGRGLAGLDAKRPWGVVVAGPELRTVVLLPCSNLDALAETLAAICRSRSKHLDSGVVEIQSPAAPFYIRQSGDYAFAALSPDELMDLPTNSGEYFDGLQARYDLAARLYWRALPFEIREQAFEQLRSSIGAYLQAGQSAWRGESAVQTAAAQVERGLVWLERTETITLGWRLDGASKKATVEVTWRAIEGRHADQVADYLRAKPTRFAEFVDPNATIRLHASVGPLPSDNGAFLREAFEQLMLSSNTPESQRQAEQQAVKQIADIVLQTATEDGIDMAMDLFPGNHKTLLVAAEISDEERLETAIKRLAKIQAQPGIEWDHATVGDARFHRITTDADAPAAIIGFGPGVVYVASAVASGAEAEAVLAQAVQRPAAAPHGDFPPAQVSLSVNGLLHHADWGEEIDDWIRAIWRKFPTTDHVVLSLLPAEHGFRVEVELEEGVVAAICETFCMGMKQGLTSAGGGR